jgi:hypothetical protein
VAVGRCHLCQLGGDESIKEIAFCQDCGHWFDEGCRSKWFDRTLEFVKKLLGKKWIGCCGPLEERHAQGV